MTGTGAADADVGAGLVGSGAAVDGSSLPFHGVSVVELAQWVFVPVTGALLSDWGADVVKVEHPTTGDPYRGLVYQGGTGGAVNAAMHHANSGKRSIGLDLKAPEGRAVLLELVGRSDVFLTNYLPDVLDRLGLGVEDLCTANPRLVYARGTGVGVRGDEADRPQYDATAFWARGGLGATLTPSDLDEPIAQRGAIGDRNAAVHLAFGVAAALLRRQRTGRGGVVDVSLLGTAMWMLGSDVVAALRGSFVPAGPILGERRAVPFNPLAANYRCADGRHLTLCCLQPDRYWADVCRAIGRPELAEDERFASAAARAEHRVECVAELAATFATRDLPAWAESFRSERFPWAPFQRVTELASDPQVVANDLLGTIDVDGHPVAVPTGAVQLDGRPAPRRRGPEHGEHTELVLMELGRSWDDIERLKEQGVVP